MRVPDLCAIPCFKEKLVARLRAEMPSGDQLEEAQVGKRAADNRQWIAAAALEEAKTWAFDSPRRSAEEADLLQQGRASV